MLMHIFLLCLGAILLYFGSEWMVRGSSSIALSFSIRPIIVGLTVVALATSTPELLVSLVAAVKGSTGISLGNILGSNVANIGLVLGASAFFSPLSVEKNLIRREIPFMLGATLLFWILCLDEQIDRADGILLLIVLGAFLLLGIITAKNTDNNTNGKIPPEKKILKNIAFMVAGLAGLLKGADLMVNSGILLSRSLGMSETFIGLSIVAVGTSLPELATSVMAGLKHEHDISIGNVVGSNIFNICLVIGLVGVIHPVSVEVRLLKFEFPALFLLSCFLFIFLASGKSIDKTTGMFFIACFILFLSVSYALGIN